MRFHAALTKITLVAALLANIFIPTSVAAISHTASTMDHMGHSNNSEVARCLVQHQSPNATVAKNYTHVKNKKQYDPNPPEVPYFSVHMTGYMEIELPKYDPIISSSFKPPDIVIETSNLRI